MSKCSNKKKYFAENEEKAVFDYVITDSSSKRHKIYNDILAKPFQKMVESIIRRYQIHLGKYDIHEVEANALSHLIENMIKYRPFIVEYKKINSETEKWNRSKVYKFFYKKDIEEKIDELSSTNTDYEYRIFESKAFSYCQTIVRNYYKDHSRKTNNEKNTILPWEDHSEEIMNRNELLYEIDENNKSDLEELIDLIVEKIRDKIDSDGSLKKNEIIVGEAIINILNNWHILFLEETHIGKINKKVTNKYQKNKILLFLKEQTRLNTKEIRVNLKPFKEIYFLEKNIFFNDDI